MRTDWTRQTASTKASVVDGPGRVGGVPVPMSSLPGSKTTGMTGPRIGVGGIALDAAAPHHLGLRSGWFFRNCFITFSSAAVEASRWSPRHSDAIFKHPSRVLYHVQSRLPALGDEAGWADGFGEGAGAGAGAGGRAGLGAAAPPVVG